MISCYQAQPFKVSFFVKLVISLLVLHWATSFNRPLYSIRPCCLHQIIPQDPLATAKVCQIIQLASSYLDHLPCTELAGSLTMWVFFQATRLGDQYHVVLSVATTTLQQQKVEAEVCTRETKSCCVQLVVPPTTAVALSKPTDSTQQYGQAPYQSLPIPNGNLLPWHQ